VQFRDYTAIIYHVCRWLGPATHFCHRP